MWSLSRIFPRDTIRQDVGDLSDLKDSLTTVGQLQPIAAQPDGTLVFGLRRLTAIRELGWPEIAVRLYTADTKAALIRAEGDENTCRKDFTPLEAAKLRARLRATFEPDARARQGTRSDLPWTKSDQHSGNLPESTSPSVTVRRQVRDLAAKPTGYSGRTLDAVDAIIAAAEDLDEDPIVREEAQRQLEVLAAPGAKVAPAAAAVKKAQKQRTRDHDLVPGQRLEQPAPPSPDLPLERRLTDGINKGQGLAALADEVNDRGDVGLDGDTIRALRRRLAEEAGERNKLRAALGNVLTNRKDILS
jgi:ParB-like chromosome segregation protein Spo0J